jgi:hypothetical protein
MADNQLTFEIKKQLYSEQLKYVYFTMAAAISAIGFSIQKTTGMRISWSMLPIGIAVLLWCISFYCGVKNRLLVLSLLKDNIMFLKAEKDILENQQNQPMLNIQDGKHDLLTKAKVAGDLCIWQFRFLVFGGIFFLLWHLLLLFSN